MNAQTNIIAHYKTIPVLTSEMLADVYRTDIDNIRQNFKRHSDRFVEGKHFFKIVGQELKDFVSSLKLLANDLRVTESNEQDLLVTVSHAQISSKTRVLTLWTERGAARHAKMLDTDQAWDVFEQLEDCYFHRQEVLAKTHKSERTPLHEAHALLVTKTKHLNVNEAWKLIHQRFGVKCIDEIPYDAIPVAVEYVHHLIALYSNAEMQSSTLDQESIDLIREFAESVLIQNFMLQDIWKALMMISKDDMNYYARYISDTNILAQKVGDHFCLSDNKGRPLVEIMGGSAHLNFLSGFRAGTDSRWFKPINYR